MNRILKKVSFDGGKKKIEVILIQGCFPGKLPCSNYLHTFKVTASDFIEININFLWIEEHRKFQVILITFF